MLQLKNHTPFTSAMAIFPDEQGIDTLYVTVKGSFAIGAEWTLLDEQIPPQQEDSYWGEPGESSLKYASDLHTGKVATDIIMLGEACAPRETKVTQMDVALTVGECSKHVRVFGDRIWHNGAISAPQSFVNMPLTYERAFGGSHTIEGEISSAELRNLVGCGYPGSRSEKEMEGIALPNIEDPNSLIKHYSDQPAPTGFGFIAPNWQPRTNYMGSYDELWQQQRAPYLPEDFDKRFFSMASAGLIYPGFLQGGESVAISGMHPDGDMAFQLPQVKFAAKVEIGNRVEQPEFNMETVLLEPNQLRLSMVWKAAVPCDKNMLNIRDIRITLQR